MQCKTRGQPFVVQRTGEAGRCLWHSFNNFICHVGLMNYTCSLDCSYFTDNLGNGISKSKNMNVDTGEITDVPFLMSSSNSDNENRTFFWVEKNSLL